MPVNTKYLLSQLRNYHYLSMLYTYLASQLTVSPYSHLA